MNGFDCMEFVSVPIDELTGNPELQMRATTNREAIEEYRAGYEQGKPFPAIDVVHDGVAYWVVDGHHRLEAAREAGLSELMVSVHRGNYEGALWLAIAANRVHGIRRTIEDKRRAVRTALSHPKGRGMSDRAIADHCGVSPTTVGTIRSQVSNLDTSTRKGRDGKSYSPYRKEKQRIGRIDTSPERVEIAGENRHDNLFPDAAKMVDTSPGGRDAPARIDADPPTVAQEASALVLAINREPQDSPIRSACQGLASRILDMVATGDPEPTVKDSLTVEPPTATSLAVEIARARRHLKSVSESIDGGQIDKKTAGSHLACVEALLHGEQPRHRLVKAGDLAGQAAELYDLYPRRVGPDKAIAAIRAALKKTSFEALREAVSEYAKARHGTEGQFTPHPATWFGQGRWADDRNDWWRDDRGRGSRRREPWEDNRPRQDSDNQGVRGAF